MTRNQAREIAVRLVYELSFGTDGAQSLLDRELTRERFALLGEEDGLYRDYPNEKQETYIRALVLGVGQHAPELDGDIAGLSQGWRFERIPRVAAAVMRTAMYEILYMPEIPNATAIDEALEIAKRYEPPEVVSFINGILGSFVRREFPQGEGSQEG